MPLFKKPIHELDGKSACKEVIIRAQDKFQKQYELLMQLFSENNDPDIFERLVLIEARIQILAHIKHSIKAKSKVDYDGLSFILDAPLFKGSIEGEIMGKTLFFHLVLPAFIEDLTKSSDHIKAGVKEVEEVCFDDEEMLGLLKVDSDRTLDKISGTVATLVKIKSGQPITQQAFDSLVSYYRFNDLLKKIGTGEHFIKKCVRIQKDLPMPFAAVASSRSASISSTECEAEHSQP